MPTGPIPPILTDAPGVVDDPSPHPGTDTRRLPPTPTLPRRVQDLLNTAPIPPRMRRQLRALLPAWCVVRDHPDPLVHRSLTDDIVAVLLGVKPSRLRQIVEETL